LGGESSMTIKYLASTILFLIVGISPVRAQDTLYVLDGGVPKTVMMEPGGCDHWEIWLRNPGQLDHWGIIEGKTRSSVNNQLKLSQKFEKDFKKFFGPEFWTTDTYSNPFGPICVMPELVARAKGILDSLGQVSASISKANEVSKTLETMLEEDTAAKEMAARMQAMVESFRKPQLFQVAKSLLEAYQKAAELKKDLTQLISPSLSSISYGVDTINKNLDEAEKGIRELDPFPKGIRVDKQVLDQARRLFGRYGVSGSDWRNSNTEFYRYSVKDIPGGVTIQEINVISPEYSNESAFLFSDIKEEPSLVHYNNPELWELQIRGKGKIQVTVQGSKFVGDFAEIKFSYKEDADEAYKFFSSHIK